MDFNTLLLINRSANDKMKSAKEIQNSINQIKNFKTMKKIQNFGRFALLATVFCLVAMGTQSFTTLSKTGFPPIIIPASTSVSLEARETLTSEDIEVGQQIDFAVRNSVFVNNVEVIRAGAQASAVVKKVIKSEKACATCQVGCAHIQIVVESVQAVDGSDVRVRSTPLDIKAPRPDCPAQLSIGKTVTASVLSNTRINP